MDCPKQSDQALHHCLYNRKSVKNYCESNSLAFTNKNETGRGEPESHQKEIQRVDRFHTRIQWIAPSKATKLCTTAILLANYSYALPCISHFWKNFIFAKYISHFWIFLSFAKALKTIDKIENKPYINITTFPDCVMVALQILVLIVGVRILLGEYGLFNLNSLFFYPRFFRLSARTWPSQG